MRLRGVPPDGLPAVSYVGKPQGSVIGTVDRPVGKIISIPGSPGAPGAPGATFDPTAILTSLDDKATKAQLASVVTTVGTKLTQAQVDARVAIGTATKLDQAQVDARVSAGITTKLDQSQVDARVAIGTAALVDSSPSTLDTLNELAAALGDDPNFATTVAAQIGTKADKTTAVTAGTGLIGGGDLSANRTLAVSFGTAAGTACQGNDARLSDARTPTAHTHTTAQVTGLDSALLAKANASLLPVQITQAAYDALGPGRPARLYAIVG